MEALARDEGGIEARVKESTLHPPSCFYQNTYVIKKRRKKKSQVY
jgi:hypothetical protein